MVELDRRAGDLRRLGEDADLDPESLQLADHEQQRVAARRRGGEDHPVDPVNLEDLGEVGRQLRPPGLVRPLGALDRRHDADQLRLDRGAEGELLAHELAGRTVADQQAALGRRQPSGEHSRKRAQADEEHEEQHPGAEHLLAPERAVDDGAVEQPEDEHRQGGEAEERRDLVERALVEDVLVAVVEPDRLRRDDEPDRDRDRSRSQLIVADNRDAESQCEGRREHVGAARDAAKDRVASADHLPARGSGVVPTTAIAGPRGARQGQVSRGRDRLEASSERREGARLNRLRGHSLRQPFAWRTREPMTMSPQSPSRRGPSRRVSRATEPRTLRKAAARFK